MNDEITFRLVLSSRQARLLVGLAVFFGGVYGLHSENLTVTSFYPSPSGIYKKLVTTADAKLARDAGVVVVGRADAYRNTVLTVGGNTRVLGELQARDDTRLEGSLTVDRAATVGGALTAGPTTVGALASGPATINGGLSVSQWGSFGGVGAGAANISGLATVNALVINPGRPEHPVVGQLWLEP